MSKIIMHVDLNAFFAACEVLKDPSLKGKPLIVSGKSSRSIVTTASYEARKFGIHSAMPTYLAKKLCPQVIIASGNFSFYRKKSEEFLTIIKTFSPIIEVASIDECYVDMTEQLKDCPDVVLYLRNMQNSVLEKTGLGCSIGIGSTKFLAKMASDMQKPMGLTIIRKKDIRKMLYPLQIENLFGIGKKTSPRLRKIGINTIGDFMAREGEPVLKQLIGRFYYVLVDWLHGKGDDEIITEPFDPKSIGNSSTFGDDTNDYEEIKSLFWELSQEVSERAVNDNKIGSTIQITFKDADFVVHNRSMMLLEPTNNLNLIFAKAMSLFDKSYKGQKIRLCGVTLQRLINRDNLAIQMSLFDYQSHESEAKSRLLINELNRRFKKQIAMSGNEIKPKKETNS